MRKKGLITERIKKKSLQPGGLIETTNVIIKVSGKELDLALRTIEDNEEKIGRYGTKGRGYSNVSSSWISDKDRIIWTLCEPGNKEEVSGLLKGGLKKIPHEVSFFDGKIFMLEKYDERAGKSKLYKGEGKINIVFNAPWHDRGYVLRAIRDIGIEAGIFEDMFYYCRWPADGYFKPCLGSTPEKGEAPINENGGKIEHIRYMIIRTYSDLKHGEAIAKESIGASGYELPELRFYGADGDMILDPYMHDVKGLKYSRSETKKYKPKPSISFPGLS